MSHDTEGLEEFLARTDPDVPIAITFEAALVGILPHRETRIVYSALAKRGLMRLLGIPIRLIEPIDRYKINDYENAALPIHQELHRLAGARAGRISTSYQRKVTMMS
ncbi:hypothetical protein HYX04_04840 [Candidatus Woesearchaeota archaeon]|nr:hypothetical protein [Candidatus Woesearchaeota archaeon]